MKPVKCLACSESYTIDLTKYGGKKIKCKKCQAIMAIPTIAEAQDEFEVVEDAPAPSPSPSPSPPPPVRSGPPPVPPAVPASILQRHRMASQVGAVNIALLQRGESSREEIREAFLAVHGSKGSRLPDSIIPMIDGIEEIERKQAADASGEVIERLKGLQGRLIAPPPDSFNMFKQVGRARADEEIYNEAVRILGKPIDPDEEEEDERPKKGLGFGSWGDSMARKFAANVSGASAEQEKKRKIATVKAALDVLEKAQRRLAREKVELDQQMDKEIADHTRKCRVALLRAQQQIQEGNLPEATIALQDLLKTATVELVGQVLVELSKCTYLSGNASNSARHIQDAVCFGASAPVDMDPGYNDLWAKATAGLPKV
jgi:hypothetical protein